MEFQVRRTDVAPGEIRYASFGWSVINLFDANYDLNVGQYKVPLYKTPTQPEIDTRDIQKLFKLEKVLFCMRIAMPKSPLAKLTIQPDTHPNHYVMPRIHHKSQIYDPEMGNMPQKDMDRNLMNKKLEEEKAQMESYECSGINIFIHYLKNYEPLGFMRFRCTLYEGPTLVRDNNGKACQWATRVVSPEEAITANQDNMDKLLKMGVYIYSETKYGKKDIVVPVNDDNSWLRDFYTMLMDNHLKHELYLQIELMLKDNPYRGGTYKNVTVADPESVIQDYKPIAATMIKCNNFDGTVRYGSYELPLFEPPLNRHDPKKNVELPYILKVTVGQPLNLAENVPNNLFDYRKPNSLFRKPDGHEDNTQFPKKNPNANNPDPFIPNEKSQVLNELFKKDDIAIVYVDAARFLPENTSFSRVVMD